MKKQLSLLIVLFTVGQMCLAQSGVLLSGKALTPSEEQQPVGARHIAKVENGTSDYWMNAMAYFDKYGWFDVSSQAPASLTTEITIEGDEVTFDRLVDTGNFVLNTSNVLKGHYDADAKTITIPTPEYDGARGMNDYTVVGTITYFGSEVYLAFFAGTFDETPNEQGQYGLETVSELVFDVSDDFSTLTARTGFGCYGFTVDGNRNQGFLNFYKSATLIKRPDDGQLLVSPETLVLEGPSVTAGAAVKTRFNLSNIGKNDVQFLYTAENENIGLYYPNEVIDAGTTMECELTIYPKTAGEYNNKIMFVGLNGSTSTIYIVAHVGEAPDFSAIVKQGDISFSLTEDKPFIISNDILDVPVAVSSNEMDPSGNSSLVANMEVPAGKTGILSWKGMSQCLHPNGGADVAVDGNYVIDNVYEHQSEGYISLPVDKTVVLASGMHDVQFRNILNMNAYLYGYCDQPFRLYVYDFSLELVDETPHAGLLMNPTVDFGRHYVDKLSVQDALEVQILNSGKEPLIVTGIESDGVFGGVFDAEAAAYGDAKMVTLTFDAAQAGTYTGHVVIKTNAGDFTVECLGSAEPIPTDYSPIVTAGEFSFDTDLTYPFIQENDYAYSSTSYKDTSNGKLVSWLEADFIVPEGKCGTLSWVGYNSSEDWFNFMGNKSFNDGTRIKIDQTIVREFCGTDPASSTEFAPEELTFLPGRHQVRFEYEKMLSVPKGEDLFRVSALNLTLQDYSSVESLEGNQQVVRTEVYSLSGEQMSQMRKGVNIVKKTYADGTTKNVKVVLK